MLALETNFIEGARVLVTANCTLGPGPHGCTPLMTTTAQDHPDFVQELLTHGAKVGVVLTVYLFNRVDNVYFLPCVICCWVVMVLVLS